MKRGSDCSLQPNSGPTEISSETAFRTRKWKAAEAAARPPRSRLAARSHTRQVNHRHFSLAPLEILCPRGCHGAAGLSRLFHPTESRVRQNYCRNAGAGPRSPHARQHSAALSTCHTTASTEKERRSIMLDRQRNSRAEWGRGATSVSSAERRRAGCTSLDTRGGAQDQRTQTKQH